MRELKFRAWSKGQKKMFDRVLAGPGDPCSMVWEEDRKEWTHFDEFCGEIMQYTGLKDRTGKEIYEGDIIRAEEEGLGVIKYGVGCFYYEDDWNGRIALEELTDLLIVVGNIYEHPHLLPVEGEA